MLNADAWSRDDEGSNLVSRWRLRSDATIQNADELSGAPTYVIARLQVKNQAAVPVTVAFRMIEECFGGATNDESNQNRC